MGGMIGQIISAMYPEKVKTFTLIVLLHPPLVQLMLHQKQSENYVGKIKKSKCFMMRSSKGNKNGFTNWMKGRIVDTPEFRKETMENLNRLKMGQDMQDNFCQFLHQR